MLVLDYDGRTTVKDVDNRCNIGAWVYLSRISTHVCPTSSSLSFVPSIALMSPPTAPGSFCWYTTTCSENYAL